VIPVTANGVIDIDNSRITATEASVRAMINLWNQNSEGPYGIRHGYRPVSDFPSAAHSGEGEKSSKLFERAFPCLYPYGRGGVEAARPVPIALKTHVQWSLRYFDRRFRKHETFPFLAFGILQRREALLSARLQMNRRTFDHDASVLSTLTRDRLLLAQREEERNLPISDPVIRLLRKSVRGTLSRVTGSNENRCQLRSQIWSTTVYLGPPSLWLTINPSDINNPIAQLFAGEEIDVEAIACLADDHHRSKVIADDPYAAAAFFHFIIQTILDKLFQVRVVGHQVKSGEGILGHVASYFGLVESQGRGTLHLHLLLWLQGTPSPERIQEKLKTAEFRDRVAAFIRENVHAYVPGLESAESIKAITLDKDVTSRGPPSPDSLNYEQTLQKEEFMLARTEQIHVCKLRRCLVLDAQGKTRCKRRAPFPCSDEAYVLETGEWGPKRLHGYVNGWLPGVLVNARCNNDIKLLTNGGDTKNITYYVTTYAAKKQSQSYNLSAVFAQGYNYHQSHPISEYTNQLKENSRLLLFRLVHAINRNQELAAPMVISYLMGWGDVYKSHTYTSIFWTSFVAEILRVFPSLASQAS
jgi:Helitron helicase-like domain at N-terminus